MKLSICSFSFHRLFGTGKQDIFRYIEDCRALGCTHLQPWCAHFARDVTLEDITGVGYHPGDPEAPAWLDAPQDKAYLRAVRDAAEAAGLPFELICVDRAAVYQETEAARSLARTRAHNWMDAAAELGARGVRIDSGGPQDLTDEQFAIIQKGYGELIAYGAEQNVSVFVENHWGSCNVPENILRFLDEIPGLCYLFDTNNWAEGRQRDGWRLCAAQAQATHVKTFSFNDQGEDPSVDLVTAIRMVAAAGYDGIWGIESCPKDGDEMQAARQTIALIKKALSTA